MDNVIHRLTLDLAGPDVCPVVEVQRGDSARTLVISLTQGGRSYQISESLTAALYATKPDGNPLFNACAIEKNQIRYDFTPQTANVAGAFDCELWLVSGDKRELTTPRFSIVVDERMRTDDVIPESAPEYTAITEMVAAGTAVIEDLREALAGLEGVDAILEAARSAAEAAAQSEQGAQEAARRAEEAARNIGAGGVKVTDGDSVGVWLQVEGTEQKPVLHLYGDHGDEPAVVRNVARAELDRDATPLVQVKELIAAAGNMDQGGGMSAVGDGDDIVISTTLAVRAEGDDIVIGG